MLTDSQVMLRCETILQAYSELLAQDVYANVQVGSAQGEDSIEFTVSVPQEMRKHVIGKQGVGVGLLAQLISRALCRYGDLRRKKIKIYVKE